MFKKSVEKAVQVNFFSPLHPVSGSSTKFELMIFFVSPILCTYSTTVDGVAVFILYNLDSLNHATDMSYTCEWITFIWILWIHLDIFLWLLSILYSIASRAN